MAEFSLAPGEMHLWFWLPERACNSNNSHRFEALLSSEELDHYERLRFPEHQRDYLVSHALTRHTLSRYRDVEPRAWTFQRNPFGKPVLPLSQGLHFNLSHTHGLAVCAITASGEVGVDVEFHANSESLVDIADQYFSAGEIADLNALPESQRGSAFFRYWTLKEAFIKARGEGLSRPLDSFTFHLAANGAIDRFDTGNEAEAGHWYFELLQPHHAYTAAVAWRREAALAHRLRLFLGDLDGWRELDHCEELEPLLSALPS
jgi:4'-phosphopantetheinyl transferase